MTPQDFDLIAAHAMLAAWQIRLRAERRHLDARAELVVGPGTHKIVYLVTAERVDERTHGPVCAALGEALTAVEAVRSAFARHELRLRELNTEPTEADREDASACIGG